MRANYGNTMNMMGQMGQSNDPGFANMIQRFQQWRQGFQGDPQQMVQQMLSNGQMSQQQFGQLQQMARQIMGMMPR